ncbi:cytoskeleton-associated protein 4-like [Stegostoma tigrinum]|uniref:cytoskeleton-associated protein 4-like n=1 Tax=Stegostoma tigrinum TaxID=3053191 RepID=UPI00287020F0|nr:cytoskeleton-associated protein 4-like [Stegostoma tigrinum]
MTDMTSVKQRNKSHPDRGSHSNQDDVAKRGSKGSKGGPDSGSNICKVLSGFFMFAVAAAAASLSAWYLHSLSQQISHLHRRSEETSRESGGLATKLETVLQQVESTKILMNRLDSVVRHTQQELQETNKAVNKGESKTNQITETLQKLQNEILRDLSDGIQDVKDARERDVTSLEKTVEEKLTELTKSIHDNIVAFTEVQEKNQNDIDEMKSKIGLLETTVETKGQEIMVLVDKHDQLKSALHSQLTAQEALKQSVSNAEISLNAVSEDVNNCRQDLQETKNSLNDQEKVLLSKAIDASARVEKQNGIFESRLSMAEENIIALNTAATHLSEKLEFYNLDSVLDTMRGVSESQASLSNDIQTLKANLKDLQNPATEEVLNTVQNEMQALEARQKEHIMEVQSDNKENLKHLAESVTEIGEKSQHIAAALKSMEETIRSEIDEKLSTMENSMDELKSSISEAKTDLEVLGSTVDSLLSKSEDTETAEDELASLKLSLNELQSDVDKLSVSLNRMQ